MKKTLLLLTSVFLCSIVAIGQTTTPALGSKSFKTAIRKINGVSAGKENPKLRIEIGDNTPNLHPGVKPALTEPATRGFGPYTGVKIGETFYDLQSNSSVNTRIVRHNDGTLSAVWTTSSDQGPNYPSRGTGYNYYDGSSWILGSSVIDRLEPVRVGFCSLGQFIDGHEIIVVHNPASYVVGLDTNIAQGNPNFVYTPSSASHNPISVNGAIWPRLAQSGSSKSILHLIADYSDTSVYINGIQTPMIYSRSDDGGQSWAANGILLPGYDTTQLTFGSAEDYSIAANKDVVAIVAGRLNQPLFCWKSTDNGQNYTKMYVDSFFNYGSHYGDFAPVDDTTLTNDGSNTVLIDGDGNVHVAWCLSAVNHYATSPDSVQFIPQMMGLMYWNDMVDSNVMVPINPDIDMDANSDGQYVVGAGTIRYDNTGATPNARYGNNSILNKPSLAMDSLGTIFIVFSAPLDNDTTTDDPSLSFRDIWVVASGDSGKTWTKAANLTQTQQTEEAFASVASVAGGNLYIVYQEDFSPGTRLTNQYFQDGLNDIKVLTVPTKDITGIKELQSNDVFSLVKNYPNPFSHVTTILVNIRKSATTTLEVSNVLGQVVYSKTYDEMTTGNHKLNFDATGLGSGVYFYTIKAGGFSASNKMIVE